METARREAAVTAAEVEALARLIEDATGRPAPAEVPFASPLLLFSRLDAARRDALFGVGPGRTLVQEQLSIEGGRRIVPDAVTNVESRVHEPASPATPWRIEVGLFDAAGGTIAEVRTAMRAVASESLAAAQGPAAGRAAEGVRRTTRPLSRDLVERWVRLVGDDNPIHVDAAHAAALGLSGPVVPGALLVALVEGVVEPALGGRLIRLNARFTAPVPVGAAIEVEIRERPATGEAARRDARLLFVAGERVAAVADLSVA